MAGVAESAKPHVLWCSHTGGRGGAELALLEGVRALRQLGYPVSVVARTKGKLLDDIGEGATAVPFDWWVYEQEAGPYSLYQRIRWLASMGKNIVGLVSYMRRTRPALVITNTLSVCTPAVAAWILRIPHVWYIHEFGDLDHGLAFIFGRKFSLWLIRAISRRVIFNSEVIRSHFSKAAGLDGEIVRYAVETRASPVWRELKPPVRLLILGQVSPAKGHLDAIRALRILLDRGYDATLSIVGESRYHAAYLDSLKAEIRTLGLDREVAFTSFQNDPEATILNNDFLVAV
jgi:glycosyltransferase involved in cell wall biosynthesis